MWNMYFFKFSLLFSLFFMTACLNKGEKPVTIDDDGVRKELEKELKTLEDDLLKIQAQLEIAQDRLRGLTISPKMYDIAKRDLFAKERFASQASQQISYVKIKINDRNKYFLDNQKNLKKEDLDNQLKDYLTDKKANPPNYPWKNFIPSGPPPPKENKSGKSGH